MQKNNPDNFIIVIANGEVILRQRFLPILYIFTAKIASWDLSDHTLSEAILLAEKLMDKIEQESVPGES